MTTIGILGMGTMGAAVAGEFRKAGHKAMTDLTGRSAVSIRRANEREIEPVEDLQELVSKSRIVFSIAPPSEAVALAEAVAAAADGLRSKPVFVDANAVSPQTMARMAKICETSGLPLVDGGIVGGPPKQGYRPRLYLSGAHADALRDLDGCAFDQIVLDGGVGKASSFKMAYAGLTKGLNALLVNQLLLAANLGFLDAYCDELEYSQPELSDRAEKTIPRLPADAERWVAEMQEIAETLEAAGLSRGFHVGAAEIMNRLAQSRFSEETRETVDAARSMKATIREL